MELFCSNENCKWSTERKGGRFIYRGGNAYCTDCAHTWQPGNTNLWGFETMNISGDPNRGPIRVNSLHHLRQLERQHGVQSVVANYDQGKWDGPPQQGRR